jgi:hypothetical protein
MRGDHLADDEWVAQPITLQPWAHPLQYAAINNTWPTTSCWRNVRSIGRSLTFKSNKNPENKEHHWSEMFRPIEMECIDNLSAIGVTGQRYGSVGLNSSEIDSISVLFFPGYLIWPAHILSPFSVLSQVHAKKLGS